MDIEQLKKDLELVRTNMKDVIFKNWDNGKKYIFNNTSAGVGKTHLMADLIAKHSNDYQFWFIVPSHAITEGLNNFEDMLIDNGVIFTHIYGKNQPVRDWNWEKSKECYCLQPQEKRHFPGCSYGLLSFNYTLLNQHSEYDYITHENGFMTGICPYNDQDFPKCQYKRQFMGLNRYDVIITTVENLRRAKSPRGKKLCIIFDESFENKLIGKFCRKNLPFEFSEKDLNKFKLYITKEIHHSEFNAKKIKFFLIEFRELFLVETEAQYMLLKFLENHINLHVYKKKSGKYILFGLYNGYLPENYSRMIFNCATSTLPMVSRITETKPKDWFHYDVKLKIENRCFMVLYGWNKSMANHFINNLVMFVETILTGRKEGKIAIITKKVMVDLIKSKLGSSHVDNVDFITYGLARGLNNWNKEYVMTIAFCRYAFDPLTRTVMKMLGFTSQNIKDMENAEMEQSINRTRPILHPYSPFLTFLPAQYEKQSAFVNPIKINPFIIANFYELYNLNQKELRGKMVNGRVISRPMAEKITKFKNMLEVTCQILLI